MAFFSPLNLPLVNCSGDNARFDLRRCGTFCFVLAVFIQNAGADHPNVTVAAE